MTVPTRRSTRRMFDPRPASDPGAALWDMFRMTDPSSGTGEGLK